MRHPLPFLTLVSLISFPLHPAVANPGVITASDIAIGSIEEAVANPLRSSQARARDRYRHPVETLRFFEVERGQTVVEFLPGGGWYTNILGPLLKDGGHYVALVARNSQAQKTTAELLEFHRDHYGRTALATIDFATGECTLPPASADRILTFRNVHNLVPLGEAGTDRIFAAFFTALKPGGILGIVDHRLPEDRDPAREQTSGYVKQSSVIRMAERAGFRLAASSEINANPRDGADWPDGVWTLPPVLKRGAADRSRYLAIGESDRMTLKFVKPAE